MCVSAPPFLETLHALKVHFFHLTFTLTVIFTIIKPTLCYMHIILKYLILGTYTVTVMFNLDLYCNRINSTSSYSDAHILLFL